MKSRREKRLISTKVLSKHLAGRWRITNIFVGDRDYLRDYLNPWLIKKRIKSF